MFDLLFCSDSLQYSIIFFTMRSYCQQVLKALEMTNWSL